MKDLIIPMTVAVVVTLALCLAPYGVPLLDPLVVSIRNCFAGWGAGSIVGAIIFHFKRKKETRVFEAEWAENKRKIMELIEHQQKVGDQWGEVDHEAKLH